MPVTLADRAVLAPPIPLLTAREARALGIRVPDEQRFQRVRPGVYADREAWEALPGWRQYQVRVHAYLLTAPETILCLESAAILLGIPISGHPRDIHVYDPERSASRRFGDVCVHTSADPREVITVGGVRVTSMLDTVIDLARVLFPAHALAAMDAVVSPVQGGTLTLDALRERADAQCARRGTTTLTELWPLVDPRVESPHEAVSHALIVWSGFERPDLQVEFRYEGHRDRVDFAFRSVRGIGEADGWGKYRLLEDPKAAATALADEKRREDRLRRNDHRFARWEPADPYRVTPVCHALQRMGVPVPYPSRRELILTLRTPSRRNLPQRASEKPHRG